VVVGGGAGGVELAFTLHHRLRAACAAGVRVSLVFDDPRPLPGAPAGLVDRILRQAAAQGLELLAERQAVAAEAGAVLLDGGERLPADALVWVTGATAHPLFEASGLATDRRGFVLVRPTLQIEGFDDLFACGDCATLAEHPETPKAGVYAVRQGPVLTRNLHAFASGRPLRPYRPQGDFLTLLNLGDGTAVGSKAGLSFEGRWGMRLKDWIDRRFVRRFQVLAADGEPREEPRPGSPMAGRGGGEMLCGGCAAKVGQSVLGRALERLGPGLEDPAVRLGLATPDDAVAVETPGGDVVVASLDAFRPFTDDPYLVGRVAAVNALSDLAAKGVAPRWAQALVAVPQDLALEAAEELLFQVLAGARATFDPLEITLLGGHTLTAPELVVGFHVEGLAEREEDKTPAVPLPKGGLRIGQELVLTKALGTGVVFHADGKGEARGPWLEAALASMLRPNLEAARVARRSGATAATDITGFGLVGHLGEMLAAAGLAAVVDAAALPALPGAVELLRRGVRSTFHPENARARRGIAVTPDAAAHPKLDLLFDPQTSGGLLFGVPADRGEETVARLHRHGDRRAAVIGRVTAPREDGAPIEVVCGAAGGSG
jgi:selenide,water dikinase